LKLLQTYSDVLSTKRSRNNKETMILKGWTKPLPLETEQAITSGKVIVISVSDKHGTYELLKGEYKVENTIICFK